LLQRGKSLIIIGERATGAQGTTLSEIWETKDGLRRVRRDPPTLDDAVLAAQGLTEDLAGQIEIVVALMSVPAEEARRAVLKMRRPDSRLTIPGRGGVARAVVVERKSPRRTPVQSKASVWRRGLG
jgi:hypothetical protein